MVKFPSFQVHAFDSAEINFLFSKTANTHTFLAWSHLVFINSWKCSFQAVLKIAITVWGRIDVSLSKHMLHGPILDWINISSIAIYCVSVMLWAPGPVSHPWAWYLLPACAFSLSWFPSLGSSISLFCSLPPSQYSPPSLLYLLCSSLSNCHGTFWFNFVTFLSSLLQ